MLSLTELRQHHRENVIKAVDRGIDEILAASQRNKPEPGSLADTLERTQTELDLTKLQLETIIKSSEEKVDAKEVTRLHQKNEFLADENLKLHRSIENLRRDLLEEKKRTEPILNKLTTIGSELEASKSKLASLKFENDELRRNKHLTVGQQGAMAENEIEQYLIACLGSFATVQNVSKIPHSMDLLVVTRDGKIRIRIDVKNGDRLSTDDYSKFFDDINITSPTAAILFMRCALQNDSTKPFDANAVKRETKRNSTIVYEIGRWAKDVLVEAIHEIIISYKLNHEMGNDAKGPVRGQTEHNRTISILVDFAEMQSGIISNISEATRFWGNKGFLTSKSVAECLRASHAADDEVVPISLLAKFENQLQTTRKRNHGMHNFGNAVKKSKH